jgi:hypothetical protein
MRVGRFDSRDLRAGRALVVLLSLAAAFLQRAQLEQDPLSIRRGAQPPLRIWTSGRTARRAPRTRI